jgi:hypothetical protein
MVVGRAVDDRAARARHPDALIVHFAVQLAASLVLQVEGVEGAQERVGVELDGNNKKCACRLSAESGPRIGYRSHLAARTTGLIYLDAVRVFYCARGGTLIHTSGHVGTLG